MDAAGEREEQHAAQRAECRTQQAAEQAASLRGRGHPSSAGGQRIAAARHVTTSRLPATTLAWGARWGGEWARDGELGAQSGPWRGGFREREGAGRANGLCEGLARMEHGVNRGQQFGRVDEMHISAKRRNMATVGCAFDRAPRPPETVVTVSSANGDVCAKVKTV